MKDRIFIAWSGTNDIAFKIKRVLETKQYKCTIGGNADNSSTFASVGDTVIQQIKSCNQAIIIFQNKKDGSVSNNLFFELGYVMAMYGTMKIHCVKRDCENVVLPSDFDNSFVESVQGAESDDVFVDGIVDYFMKRQKMSVDENKMTLISNRYKIHDLIQSHFSDSGSKCSDYELAQYVLFYMQASHMFNDEAKVYAEISDFKRDYQTYFSDELRIAVNVCLSFFDMVLNIKTEPGSVYIERDVFRRFKDSYKQCLEDLGDDDTGAFACWCRVFISNQLTYCYSLYADRPGNDKDVVDRNMRHCAEWGERTIGYLNDLEEYASGIDNNDRMGLISLLYAYVYRDMFLTSRYFKDGQEFEWLKKTKKERTSLKMNYQSGGLDSKIADAFVMEFYLTMMEYLSYPEINGLDEDDEDAYMAEIEDYLKASKKQENHTSYIDVIEYMYEQRKNGSASQ